MSVKHTHTLIEEYLEMGGIDVCLKFSLAPVDSPLDGLHLAQHGQQQGGFPTTHLAHDHRQLA